MAVWLGDALSEITLAVWERAIEWRISRQLSDYPRLRAAADIALILTVVILAAWGV
jgi:hypothetical protein